MPVRPTGALAVATLSLSVALATSCATPPDEAAGVHGTVTVEGAVESIDRTPWTYDGNAVMVLRTAGGPVEVEIPARLNLCTAEGLDVFTELAAGDRVRATGVANADGDVTVCEGPGHALHLLD